MRKDGQRRRATGSTCDGWRPLATPVELALPGMLGDVRWYGSTRFTGSRFARPFFMAPAGEHRAIPSKILPGARQVRRETHGYDAVVFEAAHRSDSALVLAPGPAGSDRLLRTFRFAVVDGDSTLCRVVLPALETVPADGGVRVVALTDRADDTRPVPAGAGRMDPSARADLFEGYAPTVLAVHAAGTVVARRSVYSDTDVPALLRELAGQSGVSHARLRSRTSRPSRRRRGQQTWDPRRSITANVGPC